MSDQKYRQRGYQDQGRTEREKSDQGSGHSPGGPRPERQPGPRGRGDLHTCKNCRHFDSAAHNECRQAVPARIAVKTKRNECTLFEPKLTQEQEQEVGGHRDARAAFDALFKI